MAGARYPAVAAWAVAYWKVPTWVGFQSNMSRPRVKEDRYRFENFTLDTLRCVIELDGKVISLRPKSFDVLRYLVENQGRPVSSQELLDAVWADAVVTEDSVRQCVNDVRKALGDDEQRIIRTVPRRGYLLDVPVFPDTEEAPATTGRVETWRRGSRWFLPGFLAVLVLAAGAWFLTRPGDLPKPLEEKSLAVLRFTDMSPEGLDSHLAEGFSEEIINTLAQSSSLKVIARTSAFAADGESIAEIAKQLGVTHVLEGSIRKSGSEIRVTAQLIDAASSTHVWSKTYDRELGDFLDVQKEVSGEVARALQVSLQLANEEHRPPPLAYEKYLLGRHYYLRRGLGDIDRAREQYEEAVAIDPQYAKAWAGLAGIARAQLSLQARQDVRVEDSAARESLEKLQEYAVEQALKFGPDQVESQFRAASYFIGTGDMEKGKAHFLKAFAIDPSNWLVRSGLANEYRLAGRIDMSTDLLLQSVQRDPLNRVLRLNLVEHLLEAGRFDEAAQEVAAVIELSPADSGDLAMIRLALARVKLLQDKAGEALEDVLRLPGSADRLQMLAMAYAGLDDSKRAEDALSHLAAAATGPEDFLRVAEVYAYRGEASRALDWLIRIGDPPRCEDPVDPSRIYYSPFLVRMDGTPSWDDWRSRMGRAMDACRVGLDLEALRSG